MGDAPEDDSTESKLELPSLSLGFGRKRRKRREPADEPTAVAHEPTTEAEPDEPTAATEPDEPTTEPEPDEPTTEPEPDEQVAAVQPDERPGEEDVETPDPRETSVLEDLGGDEEEDDHAVAAREPFRLPGLSGRVAAPLTGLLVGLLTVLLFFLGEQLFEAVRGTSSGGLYGVLLFIAILAVAVLAGSRLLRAWGQPDDLSTSFLGVGIVAILTMIFLLPADQWWIAVVIPVVSAAAYLLSWWLTARFISEDA